MSRHAISFKNEEVITKQSFKDECDINKILEKFQKSGAITHFASHAPTYGDCTPVQLHDALNTVANAETMFEELPSSIRKKFNNNAEQFLEFVQNDKNLEEMRELGLAEKAPKAPVKAKPTQSEPAPGHTESQKSDTSPTEKTAPKT